MADDSEFHEIIIEPNADIAEGTELAPQEKHKDDGEAAPKPDDAAPEPEGKEGEEGGKAADEEGELPKPAKRDKSLEGRLKEQTFHRREAERQLDAANAELQALRANKGLATKPTQDQYEDYGDFVEALTDWKVGQNSIDRAEANAGNAAKAIEQHRNAEWGSKVEAIKAVLPDYGEVAGKSEIPIRADIGNAILEADRGPELIYYFAQNPEELERLDSMSPSRAAMELGRIEDKLGEPAAAPPPPVRKTTTAPAPITPVSPGSSTAKKISEMGMDDYLAERKRQGIR